MAYTGKQQLEAMNVIALFDELVIYKTVSQYNNDGFNSVREQFFLGRCQRDGFF